MSEEFPLGKKQKETEKGLKEKPEDSYSDDPYSEWQEYKNGEVICHYEGEWDWWWPHPRGVVIEKIKRGKEGNENIFQLLLNGKEVLYEGEWIWCAPHPKGVMIMDGNKFLLNGKEVVCEAKRIFYSWAPHLKGVVIKKIKRDEEGKIIIQLLLNDKELLYEGHEGEWSNWATHPKGLVIIKGSKFFLNDKELLYEGDWYDWRPHPKGVVIEKKVKNKEGNEIFQLLLNGKELLYEGDRTKWVPHPQGIVIRKGNQLLLNGKEVLYEGDFDDWKPHPKGIVIRKGNDWIFYNQQEASHL